MVSDMEIIIKYALTGFACFVCFVFVYTIVTGLWKLIKKWEGKK